jgi:hypothetical protein
VAVVLGLPGAEVGRRPVAVALVLAVAEVDGAVDAIPVGELAAEVTAPAAPRVACGDEDAARA